MLNASNAVYFYIADGTLDSRRVSFQSTPKYLGAVIFVFVVRLIAVCHFDDPSHTIRYDTRGYFNVRSKADMSQLNLPHGNDYFFLVLPITYSRDPCMDFNA